MRILREYKFEPAPVPYRIKEFDEKYKVLLNSFWTLEEMDIEIVNSYVEELNDDDRAQIRSIINEILHRLDILTDSYSQLTRCILWPQLRAYFGLMIGQVNIYIETILSLPFDPLNSLEISVSQVLNIHDQLILLIEHINQARNRLPELDQIGFLKMDDTLTDNLSLVDRWDISENFGKPRSSDI